MSDFIPVHIYAKKHSTSRQNVYRWIRERKLKPEDVEVVEVVVKRLRVRGNAKPPVEGGLQ